MTKWWCVVSLAALPACQALAPLQHQHIPLWPADPVAVHAPKGIVGVDVNSRGEVHLFHRGTRVWNEDTPSTRLQESTILVLDRKRGKVLRTWGSNRFVVPHGLTIDDRDNIWLTDVKLHQVFKYSRSGQLLLIVGEAGVAGRDGQHFNGPTDVAVLPDGSFYVTDGYGNARVAKFSAEGRFQFDWGGRGRAEGEFRVPHAIAIGSRGQVYVADRENSRVQVFSMAGKYLRQWSTLPLEKPFGISVFNGRVIVTGDPAQHPSVPSTLRIAEFSEDGTLSSMTAALNGRGPGGDDLAIAGDGSIFVVGPWKHGVEKFATSRVRQKHHR